MNFAPVSKYFRRLSEQWGKHRINSFWCSYLSVIWQLTPWLLLPWRYNYNIIRVRMILCCCVACFKSNTSLQGLGFERQWSNTGMEMLSCPWVCFKNMVNKEFLLTSFPSFDVDTEMQQGEWAGQWRGFHRVHSKSPQWGITSITMHAHMPLVFSPPLMNGFWRQFSHCTADCPELCSLTLLVLL